LCWNSKSEGKIRSIIIIIETVPLKYAVPFSFKVVFATQ